MPYTTMGFVQLRSEAKNKRSQKKTRGDRKMNYDKSHSSTLDSD